MFNPDRLTECTAHEASNTSARQALTEQLDRSHILARHFAPSSQRKLPEGQRLWSDGDQRANIYLLRTGAICFSRMLPDGRRVVVGFAHPGDLIGLGADTCMCDADAIQDCKLDALPTAAFQRAVHADPAFARLVQGEVSHALFEAQDHVIVVSRLTAAERIAHFLVAMSNRNRRHGNSPSSVVLPMRRADIADYLGLTIETVSRTLTSFRKGGLIGMDQPSVVFLNGLARLAHIAAGNGGDDAGAAPMARAA